MNYLDVAVLNEAAGRAVALTEEGCLRFAGPPVSILHGQETIALSSFLARNAWNILCAAGLDHLASVIAVWRPGAFRMLQEEHYQLLLQHPGQLIRVGSIEQSQQCSYAGLTEDQREVVLVPGYCYHDRFRATLIRIVAEALESDDLWDIAAVIEAGQEFHGEDAPTWPVLDQAHAEARAVAYWRREAGAIPLAGDTRDARVERRYRYRAGGNHRG